MFNLRLTTFSAISFVCLSWGHIDSLRVNGALLGTKAASFPGTDTFSIGQQVPINFKVLVAHNGTRMYFRVSRDNGTVWDTISSSANMTAVGSYTYTWTVTGPATTHGRVRIFHSASPGAEGNTPNDYTLLSGEFSIASASSLRPVDFARNLSFRQTPGAILVGYSGLMNRSVHVEINDLTGAVLREVPLLGLGGGEAVISTASLSQGRIFVRVLAGDKPLANRAIMIRR